MDEKKKKEGQAEDELKAANEVLRLRLELEHGMTDMESKLPPEAENEWLNYIMNFEALHKNARKVTVHEFIGKPVFRKIEDLPEEEITNELDRLLGIMAEHDVHLDVICEYPDAVIYRFLIEELFGHETDDIRISGMKHCFIYEEFHPNHEYDLERYTKDYARDIFSKKWDRELSVMMMEDEVKLNGSLMTKEKFSEQVAVFQELHQNVSLRQAEVLQIDYTIIEAPAVVKAELTFELVMPDGSAQEHRIESWFHYIYEWGMWGLNELRFADFNL